MDSIIKSLPKISVSPPSWVSKTENKNKSKLKKSNTLTSTALANNYKFNKSTREESQSNYFNVDSYRFSSKLSNKNSLNISGYINIYSDISAKKSAKSNSAWLNRSMQSYPSQNFSTNKSADSDHSKVVSTSTTEDDSDCGCLEVGHPEMNYFHMDMRSVSNNNNTSNNNNNNSNNVKFNLTESNNSTESKRHNSVIKLIKSDSLTTLPWRRRSLTPDTAELLDKRRHSTLYADLVINQCSGGQDCIGNKSHNSLKNVEKLNYLEIDIRKTMVLEELDTELTHTSKMNKNGANCPQNTNLLSNSGSHGNRNKPIPQKRQSKYNKYSFLSIYHKISHRLRNKRDTM